MKKIILIFFSIFFIFLIANVSSLSNDSIRAKGLIEQANQDVSDMVQRGIPTTRINESLQEATQLYSAQLSYEILSKKPSYKIVFEKLSEIEKIKEISFIAQDELNVFLEAYNRISLETNLSEMQKEYDDVLNSFNSERFEDTTSLIDIGYTKISEIQSQQTAIKLFYETTSKSIKSFFKENWLKIIISLFLIVLFLLIFGKAISKYLIMRKLSALNHRKLVLESLIKKTQYDYFEKGITSEAEYNIKIKKFSEMIRDIDREIPVLKEEKLKLSNKTMIVSFSESSKIKHPFHKKSKNKK